MNAYVCVVGMYLCMCRVCVVGVYVLGGGREHMMGVYVYVCVVWGECVVGVCLWCVVGF